MISLSGDLNEDLKNVIEHYLNGSRHRSLATLARTSGVSYTTLRRLHTKEGQPSAEPSLKVIDAVLGSDDKITFISLHFPEIAKTIGDLRDKASYRSQVPFNNKLKQFFSREPHNFILNLSLNQKGSTRRDIQRLTGERGLAALDELLENDILQFDENTGIVKYESDSMLWIDPDMILNQIQHSVHHFDYSLIGTKAAKLCHLAASVNRKGLEEIHETVTEAINKIIRIKDDKENAGDIHFFVDLLMNLYEKSAFTKH